MKKQRRRARRVRAKLRAVDQINEEVRQLQLSDYRLSKKFKFVADPKPFSR